MKGLIKKGIELQMISPSALFTKQINKAIWEAQTGKKQKDFSMCSVCRNSRNGRWLCRLICKYRSATYAEVVGLKDVKIVKE